MIGLYLILSIHYLANDSALVEYLVSKLQHNSDFAPFAEEFKKGMQDENMDWLARVDWKYGCSLGTSGLTQTVYS